MELVRWGSPRDGRLAADGHILPVKRIHRIEDLSACRSNAVNELCPMLFRAIVLSFLVIQFGSEARAQRTNLSGTILAPTGDSVAVWYMKPTNGHSLQTMLAEAPLDAKGKFSMQFDLDSARSITFSDGNEVTNVFMLPGESLELSLHTAYFDETVRFSGDGAARNGALASLALAEEMDEMNTYLYAFTADPDTVALRAFIAERSQAMDRALSDLAKAHPEMTVVIEARRAREAVRAGVLQKRIRAEMAFAELSEQSIGKPAWDLQGVDMKGDTVRLSQFKGRTTVVDLWATWCGPCKEEIPYWTKLEEEHGDEVNFVSICVWDERERWAVMASTLGHRHSMFIAKEDLGQLQPYMVTGIPRYLVFDKDLNIVSIDAPRPSSPDLVKLF